MSTSFIKSLFFAAVAAGSLSACQEYDPFDLETVQKAQAQKQFEATLNEYTQNFEARFGKIDPNHTWGFGDIIGYPGLQSRAEGGNNLDPNSSFSGQGQVPNKNMWVGTYHMQVPGQPDIYYMSDGTQVTDKYRNYVNNRTELQDAAGDVPAGDVTDEEIAYVSWWFRTHRYPSSINLHWADFFIQEVSSDNDRYANGDIVKNYAAIEFNKKTDGSWINDRYEGIATQKMDQLKVKGLETIPEADSDGYYHIYNFNDGASNSLRGIDNLSTTIQPGDKYGWEDMTKMSGNVDKRMIAFFHSVGTEDWAAHYSNDQKWRNNYVDKSIWVMVHLHFIGQSGRVYDGYYLGFDYAFHKIDGEAPNYTKYQLRKPDGYYSNWIVKVSPGIPQVETGMQGFSKRVMCEDLGNTNDLDFDDVVFDVTYNIDQTTLDAYKNDGTVPADGFEATINLLASGGTMPIWVGKESSNLKYEAHSLFGVSSSIPVNVKESLHGYPTSERPIVNYQVKGLRTLDPDKITITVKNTTVGEFKFPEAAVGNHSTPQYQVGGRLAPQKFAVPLSVLWLKENRQIETAYPHFIDWVNDENGTYSVTGSNPWFKTLGTSGNLCGYAGKEPANTDPTPGSINNSGIPGTTSPCASTKTYDVIPFVNNKAWGEVRVSNGTYNPHTDGYTFNAGAAAQLNPVAKEGYVFDHWGSFDGDGETEGAVVVSAENKITVNGMKYVVAYFKPAAGTKKVKVTFVDGEGVTHTVERGSDQGDSPYYDVVNNEYYDVELRLNIQKVANFDNDKVFIGWYINGEFKSGNQNFEVRISDNSEHYNTDLTIEARTAAKISIPVQLVIQDSEGNAIDNPEDTGNKLKLAKQDYDYSVFGENGYFSGNYVSYSGQTLTYTVTVADGYEFLGWDGSVGVSDLGTSGSFSAASGISLKATFRQKATE